MRMAIMILCWLLIFPGLLTAQDKAGTANTTKIAEEYIAGEFDKCMLDLRRGEIIFFGSLPITLFIAKEIMDICRFIMQYNVTGEWEKNYSFWPLESPQKEPYNIYQQEAIIWSCISASLLVAVIDYFIGRRKGRDLAGGL